MVVMNAYQCEAGSFFFQAYGTKITYDPKQQSVFCCLGDDNQRDITPFFPKKLNFEEFERYSMRYLARVI